MLSFANYIHFHIVITPFQPFDYRVTQNQLCARDTQPTMNDNCDCDSVLEWDSDSDSDSDSNTVTSSSDSIMIEYATGELWQAAEAEAEAVEEVGKEVAKEAFAICWWMSVKLLTRTQSQSESESESLTLTQCEDWGKTEKRQTHRLWGVATKWQSLSASVCGMKIFYSI